METFPLVLLILAGCHVITGVQGGIEKRSEIQFPDGVEESDIPESCRNLTYCTKRRKNYPAKKFNALFKNYKAITQPKLIMTIDVNNRQGEFHDDCETEVSFDPLYTVREKRTNIWRDVVQVPEKDYIQRVRLETCKSEQASCFKPIVEYQDSFKTFCQQKYNTWEMLVDSKSGGSEPEKIEAVLPVCCTCNYKPV
ncbi:unnamed protein product [Leptosia nina]|uniref:Spaetzle domain-containing protein n=1 Tax=Leptosia nina TaxID=320188 RepID=A0AAV1J9X5_9NEOP